jgi:hypothetical protein
MNVYLKMLMLIDKPVVMDSHLRKLVLVDPTPSQEGGIGIGTPATTDGILKVSPIHYVLGPLGKSLSS